MDSTVASTQPRLDRDLELSLSFVNCIGESATIICPRAKLKLSSNLKVIVEVKKKVDGHH